MRIRHATMADAAETTRILNHYVLHSNARFDVEPFRVEDRLDWMAGFDPAGRWRMFVAEMDAGLAGYACTQPYRPGKAFDHSVEVSIYLDPAARTRGLGSRLYERLFDGLGDAGVHRALAGIAQPNPASMALHRKFGFVEVGTFSEYAIKHGVYISSTWMEKRF